MEIPSPKNHRASQEHKKNAIPLLRSSGNSYPWILAEDLFRRLLCLERKRAERSRKMFLLMLVDAEKILQASHRQNIVSRVIDGLSSCTRETDIVGWYKENAVFGLIFTEINEAEKSSIPSLMLSKVITALGANLDAEQIDQMQISFHLFPDDWNGQKHGQGPDGKLYPDLFEEHDSKKFSRFLKRTMDVAGSLIALVVFSPLFLAICLAIKLTSRGPVLFRQERVGRYGATFPLLKFRSMEVVNDPNIHKEYIKRFIGGKGASKESGQPESAIYKITEDPRVTWVGSLLRKTSLDELPQFLNVLRGEMSLVGPRPPIPYELESYDFWHRRRLLEATPGITGLWQVSGRSRIKFDEMVRLDLRYARTWSLWLDIKIILQTPRAVLSGEGAY